MLQPRKQKRPNKKRQRAEQYAQQVRVKQIKDFADWEIAAYNFVQLVKRGIIVPERGTGFIDVEVIDEQHDDSNQTTTSN